MGQAKYFLNAFILIGMVLIFSAYMLKDYYIVSESVASLTSNRSPIGVESITVALKDIMRSPVTLSQDDPNLIKKIRSDYLVPPSELPYALKGTTDDPSKGQSEAILELLGDKKKGFFIECGALDGETRSNTLVFEKVHGWTGALIEGDPKNFELVLDKSRKAWAVPACLSTLPYPNVVMFQQQFNIGKISNVPIGLHSHRTGFAEVQCLPLYSVLLALNTTTVNYFSLDVEGHELEVLETIPWNKVNITTLSVEFIHGKDGKEALREFMMSKGYRVYTEVTFPGGLANDFIFFHPQLLLEWKRS